MFAFGRRRKQTTYVYYLYYSPLADVSNPETDDSRLFPCAMRKALSNVRLRYNIYYTRSPRNVKCFYLILVSHTHSSLFRVPVTQHATAIQYSSCDNGYRAVLSFHLVHNLK